MAHHTTRQGHPLCHLRQVSRHHIRQSPNTSMPNLARHRLLKLLSLSTSIYGPSPSATIRLFNIYIRTLLEYGSATTCVANPSRFVQWERLQMRLITKTLDLPNTMNHDILRRYADQPTIHNIIIIIDNRDSQADYSRLYESLED